MSFSPMDKRKQSTQDLSKFNRCLNMTSGLKSNTHKLKRLSTSSESQSLSFSLQERSKFQVLTQLLEDNGLPETFDESSVKFREENYCEICFLSWTVSVRRHHCRKCGKSVCNKCSANQKPLSKRDQKSLFRICDACDCELQNFKLKQNQDDIIKAQEAQIEMLKDQIERMDEEKSSLKEKYEKEKCELNDNLTKKVLKRDNLEKEVEQLRRDLERLNGTRNMLYSAIGNDERLLKERENEKNKLINQKSVRLTDLGEKEKSLHDKEQKNEELRKHLEDQKKKFKRSQVGDSDEELKNSVVSNNGNQTQSPQQDDERRRLDKMRTDKFQFIMDSMANHRIEETNSEYSASFISESNGRNVRGNSAKHETYQKMRGQDKNSTVVVEEEEEESEASSRQDTGGNNKAGPRRGAMKSQPREEESDSDESLRVPQIKKEDIKKKKK